jgi:hypothetical protein
VLDVSEVQLFFRRLQVLNVDNQLCSIIFERGCEELTVTSKLRNPEPDPMEFTAYVRKEGKITVPKEIRDALYLQRDDLVRCKITKVETR